MRVRKTRVAVAACNLICRSAVWRNALRRGQNILVRNAEASILFALLVVDGAVVRVGTALPGLRPDVPANVVVRSLVAVTLGITERRTHALGLGKVAVGPLAGLRGITPFE